MDEQFICISSTQGDTTRFYFAKETLDLHWQKGFERNMMGNFAYGNGLLLTYFSKYNDKSEEYGVIQVHDAASRAFLREMRITAKNDFEIFHHKVGFNSKFMVIAQRNEYRLPYKMNIYDLKEVKTLDSPEDFGPHPCRGASF